MMESTSCCLLAMTASEVLAGAQAESAGSAIYISQTPRQGTRARQQRQTTTAAARCAKVAPRSRCAPHRSSVDIVPLPSGLCDDKMFFCSISGEPPQDPVVSQKSGQVYERRLIVKYINENGTDPITGDKLEESDLITIKASASYVLLCLFVHCTHVHLRPQVRCSSSPIRHLNPCTPPDPTKRVGCCHAGDFYLEAAKQLAAPRAECCALYTGRCDACGCAFDSREGCSKRVRGKAGTLLYPDSMDFLTYRALASVSATMGVSAPTANGGDVDMAESQEAGGLPEGALKQINETHDTLSAARKKRKAPAGHATPADVKG